LKLYKTINRICVFDITECERLILVKISNIILQVLKFVREFQMSFSKKTAKNTNGLIPIEIRVYDKKFLALDFNKLIF